MAEEVQTNPSLRRQPCEVYSRVVGYLRPVGQWNKGKQAEFSDRQEYSRQLQTA
ncbi:MAG: oxidoreductase [Candidatus Magasanikbacteria bacterium]|nr:oxidoreductase [Candidatus Magasanikbacteria bacterium]